MVDYKDTDENKNNQGQKDEVAEDDRDVKQMTVQQKDGVVSDTRRSDKPSIVRRWGTVVSSVLFGALLMFAVMYFGPGVQADANAVAVVNGEKITQDEFIESALSGGGSQMLDQLITQKLIRQKAKQENVTVSDKEYEDTVKEFKEQMAEDDIKFEDFLAQQGLTEEIFRETMTVNLLMEKMMEPDIKVSDEEVRQYFDENKEQFSEPEMVKAKQIVVGSEEEAEEAHKRLKDGEDFATVAKDVSIDPQTKDNGGDLGTVPKGRLARMDPDLEEKIFTLAKGELSEPIESHQGFYIVQVDEKTAAKEAKFDDEIAKQISEELKQRKLREETPGWIEKLHKDAEIDNRLVPQEAVQVTKG